WYSPSYNPETSHFYFVALDTCNIFFSKPQEFKPGETYYSTGAHRSKGDYNQKILFAYGLEGEKPVWRYDQAGEGHSSGGTMTTAGSLVFFGDDTQSFEAVDARTGRPVWHFNTGQSITASPMTYAVNLKQYVVIAAGSDVFTFALP